ncbi:hypothetical protein IAT38_005818 [Cryptococcus sp. DSM 104549]
MTSQPTTAPAPFPSPHHPSSSASNSFRLPRSRGLNRPTTWFGAQSFGKSSGSSSSSSSSGSSGGGGGGGGTVAASPMANPFSVAPSSTSAGSTGLGFKSPFPSSKGKHKLSPSPSPNPSPPSMYNYGAAGAGDEDFVMISPVGDPAGGVPRARAHSGGAYMRAGGGLGRGGGGGLGRGGGGGYGETEMLASPSRLPHQLSNPMLRDPSHSSSSAASGSAPEESPTPGCGMASATARLRLGDDGDSPIRRVPGQSRSLKAGLKREKERGEGRGNLFLVAGGGGAQARHPPASPLKHSAVGMSDDESGSPVLAHGIPAPPPQPLFPVIRPSRSQDGTSSSHSLFSDASGVSAGSAGRNESAAAGAATGGSRIPRLSISHPLRARASTESDRPAQPTLGQKKAISLDQLHAGGVSEGAGDKDALFGSNSHISAHPPVRKMRTAPGLPSGSGSGMGSGTGVSGSSSFGSLGGGSGRAHKRINSADRATGGGSMSRSFGAKSLALSLTPGLGPLPDFSHSNSSLSSQSTNNLTPPASAYSPAEPPIFESIKPLQEVFEQQEEMTVSRKFKPRDSGVSLGGMEVDGHEEKPRPTLLIPPGSAMKPSARGGKPQRPGMLKRTSSAGEEHDVETPGAGPLASSGWPSNPPAFGFLGESAATLGLGRGAGADADHEKESKPCMPDTPVKKQSAFKSGVGHSVSQPTLGSMPFGYDTEIAKPLMPAGSARRHGGGSSMSGGLPSSASASAGVVARATLSHARTLSHGRQSFNLPPPSTKKPPPSVMKRRPAMSSLNKNDMGELPQLTLTMTSSSPGGMTEDEQSPTVRVGGREAQASVMGMTGSGTPGLKPLTLGGSATKMGQRVGLLRRLSNVASESEEEEGTPSKGGDTKATLAAARSSLVTPTPSPKVTITKALPPTSYHAPPPAPSAAAASSLVPRQSLPAFPPPKPHHQRTLHHRQSHPATATYQPEEEDVFETRFITLEVLGKGAFSTVVKVQERDGDGVYAVKKARGVFDGVRDRLRHLEEVDILRHLSREPSPHVIKFQDAWEQNRQLFIQTELCLGSLAFFLEEYGRVVERLDEGRVWKVIRELSDGINHIHSNGVIHFDIKPANILISATGGLKIADFGLATRWPRIEPAEILRGAGLGMGNGNLAMLGTGREKLEREGDRVYMAPEMLHGGFTMAADIFSFGLVILEVATNICVPDGGAPWHALRENDFSVVDLSPLSPALCHLITQCMAADPQSRPAIEHVVGHPVVQRARSGKDALVPEEQGWLVDVLAGGFMPAPAPSVAVDEDVVMGE